MMHMTFYWGRQVTILFNSWKTTTWLSYFLSLFVLFLFSIFYQYLEDKRLRFKLLTTTTTGNTTKSSDPTTTPLLKSKVNGGGAWWGKNTAKFVGAFLFLVNSSIGYLLMLAIMSFNGGVFIAIVVGLGVGYFVFRSGDDDDVGAVVVDNPCACA